MVVVSIVWIGLSVVSAGWGIDLDAWWPEWRVGFAAIVVWGANVLMLFYGVGRPFSFGRIPVLSVAFALLMTVFGSASYWATTQVFPTYRVFIERAALFVAVCTFVSLVGCIAAERSSATYRRSSRWLLVWDWGRVRVTMYALLAASLVGTYVSVRRIGYLPILQGDPESLRFEFPTIGGFWYRLSMLGTIVALMSGAQICARRANSFVWFSGLLGLLCAGAYGNRFFLALPLAAVVLLWDWARRRIGVWTVATALLLGVPALALLGFWRQQTGNLSVLGPAALVLYGTLSEFRDLGWTIDYYSGSHALLHGSTLGGLIVPLLPSPFWSLVGIDKSQVFEYSNAAVLAQAMGQTTAQRVGVYGELFMNFGWVGALAGAFLYGMFVGYLDRQIMGLRGAAPVRGIVLAVVAAATVFAQVGQWNMFTSAITAYCYPILLLAFFASRRTLAVL
jgi:hypothetical protein